MIRFTTRAEAPFHRRNEGKIVPSRKLPGTLGFGNGGFLRPPAPHHSMFSFLQPTPQSLPNTQLFPKLRLFPDSRGLANYPCMLKGARQEPQKYVAKNVQITSAPRPPKASKPNPRDPNKPKINLFADFGAQCRYYWYTWIPRARLQNPKDLHVPGCRVLQGISAGGEIGAVSAYLVEATLMEMFQTSRSLRRIMFSRNYGSN